MSEARAVRHLISGRVQGVGFRWSAKQAADRIGVTGWVRNLVDGRVEAHLEGPAEDLETMRGWLEHGPPEARVETIDSTDVEPEGRTDFRVVRPPNAPGVGR